MPSSSKAKAPRRHLTLQQKVLIIEKREGEGLKQDELAQWAAAEFALPSVPTQPTISNILKDKERLREALRLNPQRQVKSVRDVTCAQFEDDIVEWIGVATSEDARLDRRAILEYASQMRAKFPRAKGLALSEGWLSRLLDRRGILLRGGDGEKQEQEQQTGEDEEGEAEPVEAPASASGRPALTPPPPRRAEWREPARAAVAPSSPRTLSPVYTDSPSRAARVSTPLSPATCAPPTPMPSQANTSATSTNSQVQEFYGKYLTCTSDLQTNAPTCSNTSPHRYIEEILRSIPADVLRKYFGCGVPIPLGIEGLDVLDLGCGSGRDAFVLSALVGPNGSVTGIDMTQALLEVAKTNVAAFTERLQMSRSSLHFVHGYMENLDQAGVETSSMDVVTSNLALSLSSDKQRVMREVFRVLRPGGEFHFSDIYASRRLPTRVRKEATLFNEGIGGAAYIDDFKALSRAVGFGEPRAVNVDRVTITNPSLAAFVGTTQFYSVTFRCFKVPGTELQATEEDYGHVAKYLGTIEGHEVLYDLDADYRFETRRPVRVGGNTAAILNGSWLSKHFEVAGDWTEHFGCFVLSPRVDPPFLRSNS